MRNLVAVLGLIAVCVGCRPRPAVMESSSERTDARAKLQPDFSAAAEALANGKFIDLTHTFDEKTIYWPTGEPFKLTKDSDGITDKGYYYSANSFSTAEHGGTHIDAPIHFCKGRETLDHVPLQRLIGEGVVIDVREKCAANRDYQIGVTDLRAWEEQHGRQLVDVIVLLRTGYSQHWPNAEKYLGTAERGPDAVRKLHFPGLDPQAAKWLVDHRSIKAIGIDTASIDYGQSQLFGSHVTLFEHNVPAMENVKFSDELPAENFLLIALPMKIGGGSGGPTRIVAVVN